MMFVATAQMPTAVAADLLVKAAPSSPAYDWSGFYAGMNMGYTLGRSNWTAAPGLSGALDMFQSFDLFKGTGSFSTGLQAGYNYMLPNRFVVGAEVDASFPSIENPDGISIGGTSTLSSPFGAESYSDSVLSSGTVRGRIGYAPANWLFYATGGFAWTYDRLISDPTGHRRH